MMNSRVLLALLAPLFLIAPVSADLPNELIDRYFYRYRGIENPSGRGQFTAALLKIESATTGQLWVWREVAGKNRLRPGSPFTVTFQRHASSTPRAYKAKVFVGGNRKGWVRIAEDPRTGSRNILFRPLSGVHLNEDNKAEPIINCDEPPDDDILEEEPPENASDVPEVELPDDGDPFPPDDA